MSRSRSVHVHVHAIVALYCAIGYKCVARTHVLCIDVCIVYIHIFCVPNSALRMYDTCEAIINTWAPIGRLSMYKQTQRQRIEQLLIIENSMTPIHRQRQWAERCYVQKHMFDACTSIVYRCIVPNGRRIYWERERDGEWHKNKFYDINIDRPKNISESIVKTAPAQHAQVSCEIPLSGIYERVNNNTNKKKIICDDFGAAERALVVFSYVCAIFIVLCVKICYLWLNFEFVKRATKKRSDQITKCRNYFVAGYCVICCNSTGLFSQFAFIHLFRNQIQWILHFFLPWNRCS